MKNVSFLLLFSILFLIIFMVSCGGFSNDSNFGSIKTSTSADNNSVNEDNNFLPIINWSFEMEDNIFYAPLLRNEILYVGSGNYYENKSTLYAVNVKTGDKLWEFKTRGSIFSTIIKNGVIFIGTVIFEVSENKAFGFIYAVDIKSGKEIWKFKTEGGIYPDLIIKDNIIFAGTDYAKVDNGDDSEEGYVYAIDINSGNKIWSFKTDGGIYSSAHLFIKDGIIYVGTKHDDSYKAGYIYAIDISTGNEIWSFETDGSLFSSLFEKDGIIYAVNSHIYAIDINDGSLLWSFSDNDDRKYEFFKPIIVDGVFYTTRIYFDSFKNKYCNYIYAIDMNSGDLLWKYKTANEIQQSLVINNGILFAGTVDYDISEDEWFGYIYAINIKTGNKLWRLKIEGGISTDMLVCNNKLYVGTRYFNNIDKGFIYSIDINKGEFLWKFSPIGKVNFLLMKDLTIYAVGNYFNKESKTSGCVYAINKIDGKEEWTLDFNIVTYLLIKDDNLYVGSLNHIYSINVGK